MATKLSFNCASQITNHPIYDTKCRYFDPYTQSGCKYNEQCWYKHITYSQQTQYGLLLNMCRKTNKVLETILERLEAVKPNKTAQTTEIELKQDTPEPTVNIITRQQEQFILEVVDIDCNPIQPTTEPTPTAIYFDLNNAEPHIITEDIEKSKFVAWALDHVIIKNKINNDEESMRKHSVNTEYIVLEVANFKHKDFDIITGNKAISMIYQALNTVDIKYRKLLSCNDDL